MNRSIFISLILFIATQTLFGQDIDVTWLQGGKITTEYNDSPLNEGIEKLIDKNSNTKFLSFNPRLWIKYEAPGTYLVTSYSFVSGNDAPERDPKNWTLEGSNNGVTWHQIDKQENVSFSSRKQTKTFEIPDNKTAYRYFKLNILAIRSGNIFQLSEWRMHGMEAEAPKDVFADFILSPPYETTVPIKFTNASLNATSYQWTFEGGNPNVSTDENPEVTYARSGTYQVTLEASDGVNTSTKTESIKVLKYQDWSVFTPPTVEIENPHTENPGYQKYLNLVQLKGYESIEEFVQSCCLTIAKELYYTPQEANAVNVRKITYKFNEGGALSYKAGSPPNLEIGFDLNYLDNFSKTHTEAVTADEIYGVLCHEVCHCYQGNPRNAGGYKGGTEAFGFIEGSADLARLLTGGFNPTRHPSPGGSWKDGYTTTAFFYQWITNTFNPDFLKDLNKTTKTLSTWSMNAVSKSMFDKTIEELWLEYQNHLLGISALELTKDLDLKIIYNKHSKILEIKPLELDSEVQIYNLNGHKLYERKAKGEVLTLPLTSLFPGIYIVKIQSKNRQTVRKFVA